MGAPEPEEEYTAESAGQGAIRGELEKTLAEAKSSEAWLRKIIDTIPTQAHCNLPDGTNEFSNKRWQEYTGLSSEEASGWGWQMAYHPEDLPRVMETWRALLATGESGGIQARLRRHDGVFRWFQFRSEPLKDETGKIVRWYGANVDIEDLKQADEALRVSERTLNLIINTIPMLAWSTDPSGSVEFLNKRWLEFTGLSAEQASGFGWSAVIHPDDTKGLLDYWQAALTSGTNVDVEARMRRFDGQYRWFLFRASPLLDESGKIMKWYGTNVDIEDRKRADEELRRSEAFLAEGQRLSRTGTFAWRPDAMKSVWSEELYRIHEIEPGAPIPTNIAQIGVHPDDIRLVNETAAKGAESGSDYEHTHRIVMADGRIKYLHVTARATRDLESRLEYIGAVQDVTQRLLSEEALTRSRSEIAHMARVMSLGVLTASIAHEINQPIGAVRNNAHAALRFLAAEPPNLTEVREALECIVRETYRAGDIIGGIRDQVIKAPPRMDIVDLNKAIEDVIALVRGELSKYSVSAQTRLAEGLSRVYGNRVQLQQVMLNLILNAIEAMASVEDQVRELVVSTAPSAAEGLLVTVGDSGPGIASEDRQRIFESFYTTKPSGVGIGLSICRSIIEAHAGRLWVDAHQPRGALFSFTLPAHN